MFQMVIKSTGERPCPARHLPEDAATDCQKWVEQRTPELVKQLKNMLDSGDDWKADSTHPLFEHLRVIYAERDNSWFFRKEVTKTEAIKYLWSLVDIDPHVNS